jgi:hypothetical protein
MSGHNIIAGAGPLRNQEPGFDSQMARNQAHQAYNNNGYAEPAEQSLQAITDNYQSMISQFDGMGISEERISGYP